MPLALGRCSSREARTRLQAATARALFPKARAPEAAMAGLYLYFSCIDDAHQIAQGVETADGSFWHGIVHRQEPDEGNAAYWFRRVGTHAIFPALRGRAAEIGIDFGPRWDPFAFIDYCAKARRHPGSSEESRALQVQLAEWQLLFHFCIVG